MRFPAGAPSGNCDPEFRLRTGYAFPNRAQPETASQFGASKRDAVSARPTLAAIPSFSGPHQQSRSQKKYEQVKVKDPAKVQISESVRSRVAQGVQYLYQDTQSPDFTNASRSITDDLLRAIEDNDAVAVDIGALKISDEYTFKHSVDVATMSMLSLIHI